jgi:GDP-D-mannose dehydratase
VLNAAKGGRSTLTLGDHLYQDPHERGVRFLLRYGDMTDATNLIRVVQDTQPDEIYNLADGSHVRCDRETLLRGRSGVSIRTYLVTLG